ncbi:MAG TPA: YciI family protein [Pseudolysinimonas sp.]|nr:YciI family protein [Pseudolysinimonas sp.]
MSEYLIAFNDEWVGEHTLEELQAKSRVLRPLIEDMKARGVLIFTGGLALDAPVYSVDASTGTPVFTDGPYVESKEHLGGIAVIDVETEEEARMWAGKIAAACGWPQEVRPFMPHSERPEAPDGRGR